MTGEIRTLSTREVYANRWMRVREDAIRRPDGSDGIYGVVEKPDFAIIAAIGDGMLHLVEQFRYPVGRRQWELPQGTWPDRATGDPAALAAAELREETGMRAGTIEHAAFFYPAAGFLAQGCHVFVASDLTPGPPRREVEEQDMIARPVPLGDVRTMIADGTLADGPSIAALALLQLQGRITL